jgi:hypothetical protein
MSGQAGKENTVSDQSEETVQRLIKGLQIVVDQQQEQTKLLKGINLSLTFFVIIVILGLLGQCILGILNSGLL